MRYPGKARCRLCDEPGFIEDMVRHEKAFRGLRYSHESCEEEARVLLADFIEYERPEASKLVKNRA